jgi:hypothetical protein
LFDRFLKLEIENFAQILAVDWSRLCVGKFGLPDGEMAAKFFAHAWVLAPPLWRTGQSWMKRLNRECMRILG